MKEVAERKREKKENKRRGVGSVTNRQERGGRQGERRQGSASVQARRRESEAQLRADADACPRARKDGDTHAFVKGVGGSGRCAEDGEEAVG